MKKRFFEGLREEENLSFLSPPENTLKHFKDWSWDIFGKMRMFLLQFIH